MGTIVWDRRTGKELRMQPSASWWWWWWWPKKRQRRTRRILHHGIYNRPVKSQNVSLLIWCKPNICVRKCAYLPFNANQIFVHVHSPKSLTLKLLLMFLKHSVYVCAHSYNDCLPLSRIPHLCLCTCWYDILFLNVLAYLIFPICSQRTMFEVMCVLKILFDILVTCCVAVCFVICCTYLELHVLLFHMIWSSWSSIVLEVQTGFKF